jgi:hypothetical protein
VTVFRCVRCNLALTRDLRLLAVLPERPPADTRRAPATVPRGYYAIDPETAAQRFANHPDRRWVSRPFPQDTNADHTNPASTYVIDPDDGLNLVNHPDPRRLAGCCGSTGTAGPNQVCTCGAAVATLISECLEPRELHLHPAHIRQDRDQGAT